jgi:hypothetical protein
MPVLSDYDERLLSAFVATPDKMPFYRDLYLRATRLGAPRLCWKWSWWAFFFGALFLLYRRAYIAAAGFFVVTFVVTAILQFETASMGYLSSSERVTIALSNIMSYLCLAIVTGGFAPYFIAKQYCDFKQTVESAYANEEDRISALALSGGINNYAIAIVIAPIAIAIITTLQQLILVALWRYY